VKIRQGITAFVPDPLPPKLTWTPALLRSLSEADRLVGWLAGEGGRLANPHLLMRPFLAREAVLSSRIEGTQATWARSWPPMPAPRSNAAPMT
jgi:hypothetical protein